MHRRSCRRRTFAGLARGRRETKTWMHGGDVGHMSCCGPLLYLAMTCRCVHVRCLFGTVLGERVMACRREFQVASRFRPRDIGADPLLREGVGIPLYLLYLVFFEA